MLARILPASKMGQVTVGPMDQNRLRPVNQSLALTLCNPMVPSKENFGYKSAVATPTCAVAAALAADLHLDLDADVGT